MRRGAYFIIPAIFLIGSYACSKDLNNPFEAFQDDADVIRAQHLKYYGDLIEEFKSVTGSYPFMEDADIPVYVFIATPRQLPKGYPEQKLPFQHRIGSVKYFFNVLEEGLGRIVPEYYDPEYAAGYSRTNYYMYVANKGTYFFAVHFHRDTSFTKKVADHYHKVDISNTPTDLNQARNPIELFKSTEFLELINRPIKKPGFFLERAKSTLHASKEAR